MAGSLNRHQVRSILENLDDALLTLRRGESPGQMEGHAAWRVRLAREALAEAAFQPIAIEMQEAA